MNKSTYYLNVPCETQTEKYTVTAFEKINILRKEQSVLQGNEGFSFIYVKRGTVSFKICGNSVFLKATNLLFLKPGSPCSISSSNNGAELIRIVFSKTDIPYGEDLETKENENCDTFGKYLIFNSSPHSFFPGVFLKLASSFPFEENKFSAYATKLFLMTEELIKTEDKIAKHFLIGTKDSISVAKEYIDNNFTENFTVSYLAEYVRLSESYLSHCFVKKYGESIKQYIIKKRVKLAIYLLENTSLSSAEISSQVGCSSPQKFNNMFKKATGKTPLSYRKVN